MVLMRNGGPGVGPFLKWEICFYFIVYVSYLLYGLKVLIGIRDEILNTASIQFSLGWPLLNRLRDDSNDELENFSQFIQNNWHWYVFHICISASLQSGLLRRQGRIHATFSCLFLLTNFRGLSVAAIGILLCSYYIASLRNSKTDIWILSGIWIVIINILKKSNAVYNLLGYEEYFTLLVLLSWTMLRCCSFTLNRIKHLAKQPTTSKISATKSICQEYSLEHYLGYSIYFPTLIHGPFFEFGRYTVIEKNHAKFSNVNFWLLLNQLVRVFFWWFVMYLSLHFLYIHYMERDIGAVRLVKSSFSQYAIVYFMGQFFFMYYVVTYGLGIAIATFDGLDPPRRPKCIGRIHFYSDMWKYFDEGLYEFLFHQIYAELCSKNSVFLKKLFATIVTFAFIFLWHGCYEYVLIWSVINFICLIVEKFFKKITTSKKYLDSMRMRLGTGNTQRLSALLATQIFIPAAYSNVYFISGSSIGNLLIRSAYCSGAANYLMLTFCSYCFVQCSEFVTNFQIRNSEKR